MESKKIATIDINIVESQTIELQAIDWRAQFLDDHHNCPLCGAELTLTNVTHFVDQRVNEEAHCESCSIKTRQATHSLQ